ncbi:MAG: CRTAC1 family protein [Planctomycetota bacterium]|nr:CRTAC1 family protein [Planctomycetota bacterium]
MLTTIALTPLLVLTQDAAVETPAVWDFRDVAAEAGVDFRHHFGRAEFGAILEDTGSGVATFDYDGDGWLDLYLVNGAWVEGVGDPEHTAGRGATNRLYRNVTAKDPAAGLRFEDVTERAGVGHGGYGMGAVVGDWDGDGDEDLVVLNFGPNVALRNNGDGTFTDVTAELGLAGPAELNGCTKWSVSGAFFDHDGDGDLDLYVANYLAFDPDFQDPDLPPEYPYAGPNSYAGQPSILYENRDGKFVDVTAASGVFKENGKTMGAAIADLDGDGDLDVFEAVDDMQNFVFVNGGEGGFTERGVASGAAFDADGRPTASMHPCIGDVDGDGLLDVFVPDLAFGCLYKNRGNLRFAEASLSAGLRTETLAQIGQSGWGGGFADFDLDGDLDLLVVLGGAFSIESVEPDLLLLNDGTGRFTPATWPEGSYFGTRQCGRGAGLADLDNDGDLDFVINHKDAGSPANVVLNDLPPGRHWVGLDLRATGKNPLALGARVSLRVGDATQVREVTRSGSYLSQGDRRLVFGLGAGTKIDALTIRWPDGTEQSLELPAIDRYHRIDQPAE